jgi:hypothetical protein
MLRRGTIVLGSLLALLLLTSPGWTFGRHGPTMGMMPMQPPGAFVHSSVGVYNPATGGFFPSMTGATRLSSRDDIFVPMNGRFIPNANGPFTLTTRESFNPATGMFTPTSNGSIFLTANGTFVTAPRRFVESATFPAATGRFVNSTTGAFDPATGRFQPKALGASMLSSSRDVFVPSHGTFVPSAHGLFTLTTREAFDRTTGKFVPSVDGQFVQSTRGTFTPSKDGRVAPGFVPGNLANSTSNGGNNALANNLMPNRATTSSTSGIFSPSPFAHMFRQYERDLLGNAEAATLAGLNNPNWNGSNPYGAIPYSGSTAGYGGGSSYPYPVSATAASPPTPSANGNAAGTNQWSPASALAAFGVPVESGEIQWPLALRLMPPDAKRDLLDKLASQMKLAANQALNGNASQALLREANSTIGGVKQWLRDRRPNISDSTYEDGDRFLRRLEDALRRMDT